MSSVEVWLFGMNPRRSMRNGYFTTCVLQFHLQHGWGVWRPALILHLLADSLLHYPGLLSTFSECTCCKFLGIFAHGRRTLLSIFPSLVSHKQLTACFKVDTDSTHLTWCSYSSHFTRWYFLYCLPEDITWNNKTSISFLVEFLYRESISVWRGEQDIHSHRLYACWHAVIWAVLWHDRCSHRHLMYIWVSISYTCIYGWGYHRHLVRIWVSVL